MAGRVVVGCQGAVWYGLGVVQYLVGKAKVRGLKGGPSALVCVVEKAGDRCVTYRSLPVCLSPTQVVVATCRTALLAALWGAVVSRPRS